MTQLTLYFYKMESIQNPAENPRVRAACHAAEDLRGGCLERAAARLGIRAILDGKLSGRRRCQGGRGVEKKC